MWLFTSIGFFSVVRKSGEQQLTVRARCASDLDRLRQQFMPGLSATMIFVALLAWNEFLIPVLLGGDNTKTLPVYISGFVSNRNLDWGPMAAASCLAIVPIALLTIALQRRLVSGLSSGALKD